MLAKAIPCPYCGMMYFKRSLPIHIKQCEQKMRVIEIPCRYCDAGVRKCDMDKHLKSCSKAIEWIIQQIEDEKKLVQSDIITNDDNQPKVSDGQPIINKYEGDTYGGALIACAVCDFQYVKAIPCPYCGMMYFKRSLPIHIKQCEQKMRVIEIPCRYCDAGVRKCDMDKHLKSCSKAIEWIIQQIEDEKKLGQSDIITNDDNQPKVSDGQPIINKYEGDTYGGALIACAKMRVIEIPCRYCDAGVRKCDMDKHLKSCPKAIAMVNLIKKNQKKLVQSDTLAKDDDNQPKVSDGQPIINKYEGDTYGGALIACAVCGRTFVPDRIKIHQ
ncbi:MAG: hypothetical protein EZS28_004741 [Streblomastix strix]|uniref:C2HC/C3H-type domain-containing protein n=1 Tax=Streblomastix strix TaxID=222440 RepID=A0A5J4WZG4_9EUKA|nr:MAG: hypothetical protein EZS28_004741 [Streblomastix strix]